MFALLNAAPQLKPTYWRNSEIPLFKPLKVVNVEPATTVNGPTSKVDVEYGNDKSFFYLNKDDHLKISSNNLYGDINGAANQNENVFCLSARRRNALGIGWIPYSAEMLEKCRNKAALKISELPANILSQIDLAALAADNIHLEP